MATKRCFKHKKLIFNLKCAFVQNKYFDLMLELLIFRQISIIIHIKNTNILF